MKKICLMFVGLLLLNFVQAQETFQVNGVGDKRDGCYAFTNATIVKDAQTTIKNATLVIRDGKIVAVGEGVALGVGVGPCVTSKVTGKVDSA